jgi:Flp pilus assembly protein TadD
LEIMSTLVEALDLAVKHHQAGDLQQAEQLYRKILQAEPTHVDAWNLLGLIAYQVGRHDQAVLTISRALRLKPDFPEAHNNLGLAFKEQGKLEAALACFREAVRLKPDYADAHSNLGIVLGDLGKPAEAVTAFQEALRCQPDAVSAYVGQGAALADLGKLDEAVASYRQALRLHPDYAEAHNNLGLALKAQGKLLEATTAFHQALRLQPENAEAYNNLGITLWEEGKPAEAAANYRQALRLQPNFAEAHNNLGVALKEQRKTAEALSCFQEALRLRPDFAAAHNNRGLALHQQEKLVEAEASFREALRFKPDYAEAFHNLAITQEAQGKLEDAVAGYQEALRLRPDYPEAHHHLGMTWLLLGNFEKGWPECEWRWKRKEFTPPAFTQPRWDGSPLAGRTILLHTEQGLGDTLHFIRYARLVQERGGRVVLSCPASLVWLLAGCPGIDQLVPHGTSLPPFDFHAPLMSLPGILGTTLASVPADVPYLVADSELVERWRRELSRFAGLKIGIAWQGNPKHTGDYRRSLPLETFRPLAQLDGVQLISLQKGPGVDQLAALAASMSVADLGGDRDVAFGPFMDTAAIMKNLDLVITADTAIAHLAGALAVPVWVALGSAPDWRWMLRREYSPWYPTMRLFRQSATGNWAEVFERLTAEVKKLVNAHDSGESRQTGGAPSSLATRHGSAASAPLATPQRPDDAESHNNMGIALAAQGNFAEAVVHYQEALRLKPDHAEVYNNLGIALGNQEKLEESLASLRQAVRLKPDHAQAHNNLGVALQKQGKLEEAVAAYRQAVGLKPDHADAFNNLGIALAKLKKLDEARDSLRAGLGVAPENPDLHNNLGIVLAEQRRYQEAAASYQEALRLKPAYTEALNNLGITQLKQKQLDDAVASFRQVLRLNPNSAETYNNLGIALKDKGIFDEAAASCRQALRLKPEYVEAFANLGNALAAQGKLHEAMDAYQQALRIKPDYAEGYHNLGVALKDFGRLDEAVAAHQQALRLQPTYAATHAALAMTWLTMGNFEQGWPEYEWRFLCEGASRPLFAQPDWDGSALNGRTILLHAEQGLGDALQFIRYVPLVQARGGRVVVCCPSVLLRILGRCKGIDALVAQDGPLPPFDVQAPLLSLPGILKTTLANVPAKVPYIFPVADLTQYWALELSQHAALTIGIAWQGNPKYPEDRKRSIPLEHFAHLAQLDKVQLLSLQKGHGTEQLPRFQQRFSVMDLGNRLDEAAGPFMDTAAVMKNLDLVITSDTSVAHLAGALGVRVWVALPWICDWRWLLQREDSPWYPTMRLFRQTERGNWDTVFRRMAGEVRKLRNRIAGSAFGG